MLLSGLPDLVADEEPLARFLTQSNQVNSLGVKPSAFLPSPKDRETSVSRHGPEPIERLWKLGLEAAGGRNLHGVAFFKAHDVRAAKLEILADEPPEFHAVIRSWVWDENDPELQKAQQKEAAMMISKIAGLLLVEKE